MDRDAEMDGQPEGQGEYRHVQHNGAGQPEGFSVIEPWKGAVCGEVADEAAENGPDQNKHDKHPGAFSCDSFTHM